MPWGLAIGAVVGLAKNQLVDVPREKKQRALAAATQKYSPWTGLQAQGIQQQDPFGNALQFGAAGAGMKSGWGKADAEAKLLNTVADRYEKDKNMGNTAITLGGGLNGSANLQLPSLGASAYGGPGGAPKMFNNGYGWFPDSGAYGQPGFFGTGPRPSTYAPQE